MFFPVEEIKRQFIDNQKSKHRHRTLTQRWRALKMPGRLYWRNRVNWRDWDGGAVACHRNGAVRTWYDTLAALEEDIEYIEYWQNEPGDKLD